MLDFFAPVALPRLTFEEIVRRIDAGVSKHGVALVLNEDQPYAALEIVDADKMELAVPELGDIEDIDDMVGSLDPLLLFAFERRQTGLFENGATSMTSNFKMRQ